MAHRSTEENKATKLPTFVLSATLPATCPFGQSRATFADQPCIPIKKKRKEKKTNNNKVKP